MNTRLTQRLAAVTLSLTLTAAPTAGMPLAGAISAHDEPHARISQRPEERISDQQIQDAADIMRNELNIHESKVPEVTTYGLRGAAAKEALKRIAERLHHIGPKGWNAAMEKVTFPNFVKHALRYEVTVKAIDIAVGFSGEITQNIEHGLEAAGVPGWIAGPGARLISLVFL